MSDQEKIKVRLESKLRGTDSEVVIPYMEYYRRGEKKVKVKPVFPGYTFIHTAMDPIELHKIVREVANMMKIGVRELNFREQFTDGQAGTQQARKVIEEEEDDSNLKFYPCISPEEEEYIDVLCKGDGLFKMSYGYEEDKRYIVMEGPLKVFEDKIFYVDKHNRRALLRFEFNGRRAQAGFEVKPKAHWFEDEEAKVVTLKDGSEYDLNEIEKKMTSSR